MPHAFAIGSIAEQQWQAAFRRNRQIAAHMFAALFTAAAITQFVLLRTVAAHRSEGSYLFILPVVVFCLAVYEWVESRRLQQSDNSIQPAPDPNNFAVWMSAIMEALVPVSGILLFGGVIDWSAALGGPPIIAAALIPFLSILRLDFRIPLLQGIVGALGFLAMLGLASVSDAEGSIPIETNLHLGKTFLLFLCGVLAAVIAHQSRRRLHDVIHEHVERENVQQALQVRTAEYQRAAETILEKNELLSILSHDLRAPLDGVASLAQMMGRSPKRFTTEDIRKYAGEIHDTAHNLRELLDNLVAWAELRARQHERPLQPLSLAEVCAPVAQLFEPAITARQLTIDIDLPVGPDVLGDAAAVATVARNLLSNAVKFSPSGGRITLRADTTSSTSMRALVVTDTGAGFTKAPTEATSQKNGGKPELGLALCRQLLGQMEGKLEFHSASGGGTEARAWLRRVGTMPPDDHRDH